MLRKTRGYRKKENGYELVTSNYISSLSEADQIIFRDKHRPFYLEPSDDGPRMTYNTKNRTFSFYGTHDDKYFGSHEESATHRYCIEELANLNELLIISKNDFPNRKKGDVLKFSFNYAFSEIVLQIGETYIKPDLLLYIREPYDLGLRWNRLLAIEVVVSHGLDGKKLELMRSAKIPVLRIRANKKWGRKKEDEMNDKEKSELRTWIKNSFKKGYSADLLLDSKSKVYLENKTINILESEKNELQAVVEKYSMTISKLSSKNAHLISQNNSLISAGNKYSDRFSKIEHELHEVRNINLQLASSKRRIKKCFLNTVIILVSVILIESFIIYFYLI